MSRIRGPKMPDDFTGGEGHGPPPVPFMPRGGWRTWGWPRRLVTIGVALVVAYGLYFWEIRRVVVPQGHVLVVMKKDGSRSLPGDQFIIPREPAPNTKEHDEWARQYADANGILEEVYQTGQYFRFSPFDYEREVIDINKTGAIVPNDKVGIVIKKFGTKLDLPKLGTKLEVGQVLADPARDQCGPLATPLQPGTYVQYANPYAYEIKLVKPVNVEPAHLGVVTLMSAKAAQNPNDYLVDAGERGVQRKTEPPGFLQVNPYDKRVTPISIQSQQFHMSGDDIIKFPSSDSFEIQLEGFVEWSVIPKTLPLTYVQYGYGAELIQYMKEEVLLPNARSYCRLVGSQYRARDFISGETRLKFQQEFETQLKEACRKQGIEVLQALVRDIVPPREIKDPINEREIAKEQVKSLEQQIVVAKSKAELATQEETGTQNKSMGEATQKSVTIVKKAEQERDVAVTGAQQRLAVAKLKLDAAQKEADALVARGQAEAAVVLLQKQAEAEPLRRQVEAFGDGNAYAQYFFFQKVAPSMKSILADTSGAFGEMFKQFAVPAGPTTRPASANMTEVRP